MADHSIDKLNRLFLREKGFVVGRDKTPAAAKLKHSRAEIADFVRQVGKSGDLEMILEVEKRFVDNDLTQYANSGAMANSLKGAMAELEAAEKTIPLVKDPVLYRAVDDSHGHPKSRAGSLPKDAARQFFASHAARLLNWDKSRLDDAEKQIIDLRKSNMRTAEKLYADRQRKTLGIEAKQEKGMGKGLEL
jgi:hypothetical protein